MVGFTQKQEAVMYCIDVINMVLLSVKYQGFANGLSARSVLKNDYE